MYICVIESGENRFHWTSTFLSLSAAICAWIQACSNIASLSFTVVMNSSVTVIRTRKLRRQQNTSQRLFTFYISWEFSSLSHSSSNPSPLHQHHSLALHSIVHHPQTKQIKHDHHPYNQLQPTKPKNITPQPTLQSHSQQTVYSQ